jgi:hypothetical protein
LRSSADRVRIQKEIAIDSFIHELGSVVAETLCDEP